MAKNKTKKATKLGDMLAKSLEQGNKPVAKSSLKLSPITPTPAVLPNSKDQPMPAKPPTKKISTILTETDQEHLNNIIDILYKKGERITTSQALKIALELCPTSETKLLNSLQNIKAADKRRKHK